MDPELQIKALVDTLAPRTAHQYKLYHTKYLQWCRENRLVRRAETNHPYKDVIVTAPLVHWFILANFVCKEDAQFSVSVLRKMISAFKFLHRICKAYEPDYSYDLDHDYLEGVARLHVNASSEVPPLSPLKIVSVNMWSPHGTRFSEKFFKGGIEKLRFLVDFHVQQYWHFTFADRAKIRLGDLYVSDDRRMLLINQTPPENPGASRRLALLPQSVPWECPLVTLAAYLYLRFYGATKSYKGDGFPDLSRSDDWYFLPLIRGKSLDKYPREETMTNYYADVFRHCHLPYKRREYFYNKNVEYCQYPITRNSELKELQRVGGGEEQAYFPQSIPIDFIRHMNRQSVYEPVGALDAFEYSSAPQALLVQIFPEIEEYKRETTNLSEESYQFLKVLELLRYHLLRALPFITHFFPEHEILRDSMFQNPEFQSFFQQKVEELRVKGQLQRLQPEENGSSNIEHVSTAHSQHMAQKPPPDVTSADSDLDSLHTYLRDQTFQMVQYQSATNFHLLIQSLSRVFEKLETKKSNREYILHQLGSLEQTLQDRISRSSPDDVKKEENSSSITMEPTKPESTDNNDRRRLDEYDSDAENDDDYREVLDESRHQTEDQKEEDDEVDPNLQDELQTLVSQVMDVKFKVVLEEQTKKIETHVNQLIAAQVKEEVRKQLAEVVNNRVDSPTPNPTHQHAASKRVREDSEPPLHISEPQFALSPYLDSIEDVVLEWFTPNPEQRNECVHTMNRKYGKTWRSRSPDAAPLYRQRKMIVEFYICLVNQRQMDRYRAVAVCENLRGSETLDEFSGKLKEWKKNHQNSFDGLG
ncbi:LADA_0G14796g1_1 [Lachancea dasiensis]|uniref:LADA_0G14796g1_1 n=1 Tax=Lachancea dasiensis TaxID=1072105 RepID=A0A1G4JW73_9SACH|nr:LADA_0G14796g1_1 [Lachancea dasiensis]